MGALKFRRGAPPQRIVYVSDKKERDRIYRGPNWYTVRHQVHQRDKVCQMRGHGVCEGKLQVNHIVFFKTFPSHRYKEANDLKNLELLCEHHHKQVDRYAYAVDWHPEAICVRVRELKMPTYTPTFLPSPQPQHFLSEEKSGIYPSDLLPPTPEVAPSTALRDHLIILAFVLALLVLRMTLT